MKTQAMIIRGRTVEEALLTAEKTFGADRNRLQVEVLDEGQRGFLGLMERQAVIRVTALQPDESQLCEEQETEPDCDGTVEVRHGDIYVHDPRGKGKPAVVTPAPEVILIVNDVIVLEPTPVWENDKIEIELVEKVYPAEIEVEISDDSLTAYVKVTPQIIIHKQLIDQDAQHILELLIQRHEEKVNTVTPTQIEEELQAKGVAFGLDHDAIGQAAAEADGAPIAVARGKPVQQGKNGFVEYLFDSDPVEIVYDEDERVDYWERYVFPSVKEGDVLAVLHLPVPGVPGMMVTGKAIAPDPVYEDMLRVKDGVRISDDGREAIATIAGRPLIEDQGMKYLRVTQLMTHPGDVDMASGNLRFHGDLQILGNVTEGMQVSALGDVTVKGNVTGAVIRAGSRVICQGSVIQSQIYAGGLTTLYAQLAPLVDDIGKLIDETIQETAELQQRLVSSGEPRTEPDRRFKKNTVGKIVRLLMKKKAKSLDTLIKEYTAVLDATDLPFPPAVTELVETLKDLTCSLESLGDSSLETLESIVEKKYEVSNLLDSLPDKPNDIVCNYVQNSNLEAAGSINVTSKGGFYSTLRAAKDVSVRGVFRGGEISAEGNVFVHEAGSPGPSSGDVKIKVARASTVEIRKVFPETMVQVGNRSHIVKKEQNVLKVKLTTEGDISLETFSD